MRRRFVRGLAGVVALVAAGAALYVGGPLLVPLDRQRALAELDLLERHLAAHYANLDWMVSHRGMDLVSLDRQTRAQVASARVRGQAQFAIRAFVSAFQDPHLRAGWPSSPEGNGRPPAGQLTCVGLGYESRDIAFRVPFDSVSGWKPYAGAPFPAGRVGQVGVVRIGHFGEDGYRNVCEQVGVGTDARDTQLRVRGALQHTLHGTLKAFESTGVTTVLIDVTGNGGGTEWAEEAARLFTAGPVVRRSPVVAAPACDRMAIWRGASVCPVLPALEPLVLPGLGAWTGNAAILADGDSGSATEDFIVRLRESGIARLLGERTAGAGCGYVDGGAPILLPHIGLVVRPPNCARFTREGLNEIEGLTPDVAVPLSQLPGREGAAAVLAAVGAAQ